MSNAFEIGGRVSATPVTLVTESNYSRYRKKIGSDGAAWLDANGFEPKQGRLCPLPGDSAGQLAGYLAGIASLDDYYAVADLPLKLPAGVYSLDGNGVRARMDALAIGWGLGCYQFARYKKPQRSPARLKLPGRSAHPLIVEAVDAVALVRDLINTPAEDMMPQDLASVAEEMAQTYAASFSQIVGDDLLAENYPCIHTVGRASVHQPRLIDMRWGSKKHPLVTLVGKGVTFDSGGLDLKPAAGMRQMKKDMGGAAHVLGLARMIMALELPIQLRVLIPTAENAVSSNSFRPGDVIRTRHGLSVEIDNTDAEGRLLLCDALSEACAEKPDLIVDFATLTGAARVAVGTEIAAYFASHNDLSAALMSAGETVDDPVWQLPLHKGYDSMLDSKVADLQNCAPTPFGGAITAALYLRRFVDKSVPWFHFDIMAYNNRSRRGRPVGGEAMGVRAVFEMLHNRYASES